MSELDTADLIKMRKDLGMTQSGMAVELGMSIRAYQEIENGRAKYRKIHRLAMERVAMTLAAAIEIPDLAPLSVREDAAKLATFMPKRG